MRNANSDDVNFTIKTLRAPLNVVFNTPIGLAHIVKVDYRDSTQFNTGTFFMESICGNFHGYISVHNLREVEKKQGTPPKPKKPHVKGSKPFVYNPDNIKVGTKVKCRDGKVRVVEEIKLYSDRRDTIRLTDRCIVWKSSGKVHLDYIKYPEDIIYVYPEEKKQEASVADIVVTEKMIEAGRIASNKGACYNLSHYLTNVYTAMHKASKKK